MKKIFKIGSINVYTGTSWKKCDVFVFCKYVNARLSLTGVIGPKKNGDCWDSLGQIQNGLLERIADDDYAGIWNKHLLAALVDVWNKHHLNDLHAGTPEQEHIINTYLEKWGDEYSYDLACEILKEENMYIHDGYKYGTAWLFQPVPESVLLWLDSLPDDTTLLKLTASKWAVGF